MNHRVIGPLSPWANAFYPTKLQTFDNGQVHGLAFVADTSIEIEIGMIMSHAEGSGQVREFVRQLKENYRFIRFWAVVNPILKASLLRYGFTVGCDIDEHGEMSEVMDWVKA